MLGYIMHAYCVRLRFIYIYIKYKSSNGGWLITM